MLVAAKNKNKTESSSATSKRVFNVKKPRSKGDSKKDAGRRRRRVSRRISIDGRGDDGGGGRRAAGRGRGEERLDYLSSLLRLTFEVD